MADVQPDEGADGDVVDDEIVDGQTDGSTDGVATAEGESK